MKLYLYSKLIDLFLLFIIWSIRSFITWSIVNPVDFLLNLPTYDKEDRSFFLFGYILYIIFKYAIIIGVNNPIDKSTRYKTDNNL